jgi:hypothetical protein
MKEFNIQIFKNPVFGEIRAAGTIEQRLKKQHKLWNS